jgi:hypothetical protein
MNFPGSTSIIVESLKSIKAKSECEHKVSVARTRCPVVRVVASQPIGYVALIGSMAKCSSSYLFRKRLVVKAVVATYPTCHK